MGIETLVQYVCVLKMLVTTELGSSELLRMLRFQFHHYNYRLSTDNMRNPSLHLVMIDACPHPLSCSMYIL